MLLFEVRRRADDMAENPKINGRIDIDSPRWDQSTFMGRLKHFAWMTDYRTAFVGTTKLHNAKDLLEKYRFRNFQLMN